MVVVGHSHRNAYRDAVSEGYSRVATLEGSAAGAGPAQPDSEYWESATEFDVETLLVVWTGNQNIAHFLFAPEPPLRLFDGTAPGKIVPSEMVSALWHDTLKALPHLVRRAKAGRVLVAGTPPPKTERLIRQGIAAIPSSPIARRVAELGETPGTIRIADAHLRIGTWRLLQDDLRQVAEAAGATFLPVPGEVFGRDGLLREEFSVPDASHANAAFGRLMLDELSRLADLADGA